MILNRDAADTPHLFLTARRWREARWVLPEDRVGEEVAVRVVCSGAGVSLEHRLWAWPQELEELVLGMRERAVRVAVRSLPAPEGEAARREGGTLIGFCGSEEKRVTIFAHPGGRAA